MIQTPDVESMVVRARGGDREAIAFLIQHFSPQVRAKIASKVNLPWQSLLDEEDVMQVTACEVYLRIDRFKTGGSREFLAWLYRLAENNLIDAVRSLEAAKRPPPDRRISNNSAGDTKTALINALVGGGATPSVYAARDEAATLLDRALAKLPEVYEKVVRLYDLQCRSIKEVSTELGRSEGAVFMLRARAHDRLRELLGSESQYFSSAG